MDKKTIAIAIVTVHGTGDTAIEPDGDKWFQRGSVFSNRVKERLDAKGVNAEVIPHLWTGANSASARERGSLSLAKRVRKLAKSYDGVHVIGHSHGGNVANDAACMLGWSDKKKKPKIASVTTVGTPFFKTIVRRSERIGAWAFLLMVIVSMTVFGLSLLTLNDASNTIEQIQADLATSQLEAAQADPDTTPQQLAELEEQHRLLELQLEAARSDREDMVIGFATIGVISGIVVIMILPLAFRGISRIRRAGRKAREKPEIQTIWHPNDEAIAFLQRVESLPIEVFPRWSLLRGSRTGAIMWGVRAAIWTPVIGGLIFLLAQLKALEGGIWDHSFWNSLETIGGIVFLIGLVGSPLLFGAVYVVYRAIVALILEFGLRSHLNDVVGNALKGLAMGRDGDNRIGQVSERSHYYGCSTIVLEGDLAERMLVASQDATRRLFDKYRSSLFSVGVGESNAVGELTQDAMTWDSLIHTTYFDQPEIADMIADRIAAKAAGSRAAAADGGMARAAE